ncbi:hypothetical protein CBW65_17825 [Tumebacillus avium]|uniref:DUF6760 domain-containing protein n=1 Tax=Tumebacillus avium TaxID=1903704 RepID=A0A1Y0IQ27_9BACL|nr:hypothetical protein CBW65_17825 [Tumebacillus avium]
MTLYPVDKIYEEVGFIAYYFHWPHDEIMSMDHRERRRWCDEISRINRNLNGEKPSDNPFDIFGEF